MRIKPIVINLSLTLGSVLVGLVLVEIILARIPRFANYVDNLPPMYQADSARGWKLKANFSSVWADSRFRGGAIAVHTDSLGNRRIPATLTSTHKPLYRILVLGDSFTFGWGVEGPETYAALLQQGLDQRFPDWRIKVVNSGVPGYGPEHEWHTLQALYDTVQPHLIVIGFTENDFENVASGLRYVVVEGGKLVLRENARQEQSFGTRLNNFIVQHSILARIIYDWKEQTINAEQRQQQNRPFLGYTLEVLRRDPVPAVQEALIKTQQILADIKTYGEERGSAFLLAALPRSYQIYTEEFNGRMEASGLPHNQFSPDVLTQHISSICEAINIPFLSLKPSFVQAREAGGRRDDIYLPYDGHWSVEGHKIAAEAMISSVAMLMVKEQALSLP